MTTRTHLLGSALLGVAVTAAIAPLGWWVSNAYVARVEQERSRLTCAALGGLAAAANDGFQICILPVSRATQTRPTRPREI